MATTELDPAIVEAIGVIERYVEAVSGWKPSQRQIAKALKRYFVLREINDHMELDT